MCKDLYQINDKEVLRDFRKIAYINKGEKDCWIKTNDDG